MLPSVLLSLEGGTCSVRCLLDARFSSGGDASTLSVAAFLSREAAEASGEESEDEAAAADLFNGMDPEENGEKTEPAASQSEHDCVDLHVYLLAHPSLHQRTTGSAVALVARPVQLYRRASSLPSMSVSATCRSVCSDICTFSCTTRHKYKSEQHHRKTIECVFQRRVFSFPFVLSHQCL